MSKIYYLIFTTLIIGIILIAFIVPKTKAQIELTHLAVKPVYNLKCIKIYEEAQKRTNTIEQFNEATACLEKIRATLKDVEIPFEYIDNLENKFNLSADETIKVHTQISNNIDTDYETKRGKIIVNPSKNLEEIKTLIK